MKKYLLILMMFAGFGCSKTDYSRYENLSSKVESRTAKGVTVFSYKEVSPQLKQRIDAGLDELFDIAENPPYSYAEKWNRITGTYGFSRHGNYTAWILERSPKCENAAFLMTYQGSQYDQTEFDKDNRVGHVALCAAGAMRRRNITGAGIVITDDLSTAADVSRYEGEHNLLLEVDPVKFTETQYHQNSSHPIIPRPNALTGERSSFEHAVIDGDCILVTR